MRRTPSGAQGRTDDPFVNFDYSQPPLAEVQILRLLENHIKRKKRDQLDNARNFKQKLMKKEQVAKQEEEEKDEYGLFNATNPQDDALKVRTS